MNVWLIIIFILSGFIIGYFQLFSRSLLQIAGQITMVGLILLLVSMGAKIGMDEKILTQLDRIGLQALFIALGSISGSILLVKVFSSHYKLEMQEEGLEEEFIEEVVEKKGSNFITYLIILSVVLGIVIGFFVLPSSLLVYLDGLTMSALAVLLFGVGIDLGKNKEIYQDIKLLGWKIVLIPLTVAVGSIIGSIITGCLIGLGSAEAAAVGAGFGWYSLSAVMISQIHSVELGSLAFLANVFRELLTVIFLPFVVRYLGKIVAIAPGGATTMDVTLPLIKETAGEEMVIPAFINGAILSALVPFLVPFFLQI